MSSTHYATGIQSAEVKAPIKIKGRFRTATEVDLNHEFDSLHILIVIDGASHGLGAREWVNGIRERGGEKCAAARCGSCKNGPRFSRRARPEVSLPSPFSLTTRLDIS